MAREATLRMLAMHVTMVRRQIGVAMRDHVLVRRGPHRSAEQALESVVAPSTSNVGTNPAAEPSQPADR